jgi:endonuclease YncB( thermonuclease family)
MNFGIATFLFTMLLSFPSKASDQITFTGHPAITDGDTIKIGDTRIRLHGIDTPEAKQTCQTQNGSVYRCGDMATFALAALIEKHWVTCSQTDKDRYGRVVAVCFTGPVNLNAEMVRSGWALAYRKYSNDYVSQEDSAKAAKVGLWQGKFEKPWEWRSGKRLTPGDIEAAIGDDCQIKGNINSMGDRIYHMPDTRWYSQTVISVSKGEIWFCTEAQAVKSGWRKPH